MCLKLHILYTGALASAILTVCVKLPDDGLYDSGALGDMSSAYGHAVTGGVTHRASPPYSHVPGHAGAADRVCGRPTALATGITECRAQPTTTAATVAATATAAATAAAAAAAAAVAITTITVAVAAVATASGVDGGLYRTDGVLTAGSR